MDTTAHEDGYLKGPSVLLPEGAVALNGHYRDTIRDTTGENSVRILGDV